MTSTHLPDDRALPAPIAFIGAGRLGRPTLESLLTAGAEVRLHTRRAEVRDAFQARVSQVSDDPETVLRDARAAVVFVYDGAQLRDVLLGDDGRGAALSAIAPGGVVIVHTTATVGDLDAIAEVAQGCGVSVVDAPVSGTADDIRDGRLTVLLGGDDAAVSVALRVVSVYAGTVLHVGACGAAMRAKLVNNLVFAAHVQIALRTADLAEAMGLDRVATLDAILACSGASSAMERLRDLGADPVDFGARVGAYLRKDVAACEATAAKLDVDVSALLRAVRAGPLTI